MNARTARILALVALVMLTGQEAARATDVTIIPNGHGNPGKNIRYVFPEGVAWRSGNLTWDLAAGTYQIEMWDPSTKPSFTVDGAGNTTSSDPRLIGGAGTVTFNVHLITVTRSSSFEWAVGGDEGTGWRSDDLTYKLISQTYKLEASGPGLNVTTTITIPTDPAGWTEVVTFPNNDTLTFTGPQPPPPPPPGGTVLLIK